MKDLLAITKALSDESRLRALWMLRGGELCVCQVIDALKLAPATVSKHMTLLHAAGLVVRRKEGKWAYYRWPKGREASGAARAALRFVEGCLGDDPAMKHDEKAACCARDTAPEDLCDCYRN